MIAGSKREGTVQDVIPTRRSMVRIGRSAARKQNNEVSDVVRRTQEWLELLCRVFNYG
jgi:hypothetical protein